MTTKDFIKQCGEEFDKDKGFNKCRQQIINKIEGRE
jgi:hypothetical protein